MSTPPHGLRPLFFRLRRVRSSRCHPSTLTVCLAHPPGRGATLPRSRKWRRSAAGLRSKCVTARVTPCAFTVRQSPLALTIKAQPGRARRIQPPFLPLFLLPPGARIRGPSDRFRRQLVLRRRLCRHVHPTFQLRILSFRLAQGDNLLLSRTPESAHRRVKVQAAPESAPAGGELLGSCPLPRHPRT